MGQWNGQWKVLVGGQEVYRFGGIGNSQADANRIAAAWLRQNGQGVSGEGFEVYPVMDESLREYRMPQPSQGVAEGYLNEASSDEAWELVGQPVPEIQQFVKQMGYGYDDQSVAKITAVIDRVISTQLPVASIPKLKNLANKGTDVQTLKAVQQISGKPDAEQQYTKLMKARDAAEGRERDVSGYLQYVKSGNYDPPVLLKLPTGIYVIGGRTRLYAALALGVPANVKIISANDFQQGVAENFADGKNPGRKGLSKRVGVNTKASVSSLRKTAKNSSGEKQRMAHWLANMKSGRAKAKRK
jgi:hypothetical protein